MSREIFERVYLPDEWKPAYNAARLTRSQLHWIDLREHPWSFDELGDVWRTTAGSIHPLVRDPVGFWGFDMLLTDGSAVQLDLMSDNV